MVRHLLLSATAIPAATVCRRLRLPLRRALPLAPSFFASRAAMGGDSYRFGPYKIAASEVFHSTDLSYAVVNLRPVVPGHVLVCPRREVKRFADLSTTEISDLWITAQNIGAKLECYHKATSLTFSVQDCIRKSSQLKFFRCLVKLKKMDLRLDKRSLMYIFTSFQGKMVILQRMMKFMMLLIKMRRSRSLTWTRKGQIEAQKRWLVRLPSIEHCSLKTFAIILAEFMQLLGVYQIYRTSKYYIVDGIG